MKPMSLALAGGITWALALLIFGLGSMALASWQTGVLWLGQFYLGYAPTLAGSITGAVWGFFDLFIGLYVFAWLYNYFEKRR